VEEEREEKDKQELSSALRRVPLLDHLTEGDLGKLMEEVEVQNFASGEDLVRQGESGDSFYIILKGKAAVYIKDDTDSEIRVGSLDRYGYFGEMSLLQGDSRNATVRASEDCTVAIIYRDAFKHLIESNEGILDKLTEIVQKRIEENRAKLASSGTRPDELPPQPSPHRVRASIARVMGFLTRKGS
jgi:CRP-like cAMP-binding protein